jgi:hypothetical protein
LQVYRSACELKPCCVDQAFSLTIINMLRSLPEASWDHIHQIMKLVVSRCKVGNFEIECGHRQVSDSTQSKRYGRAKSLSLVSSEYLLGFIRRRFSAKLPVSAPKSDRRVALKKCLKGGHARAAVTGLQIFEREACERLAGSSGWGLRRTML